MANEQVRAPVQTTFVWPSGRVARLAASPNRPPVGTSSVPFFTDYDWPNPPRRWWFPTPVVRRDVTPGSPAVIEVVPLGPPDWQNPQRRPFPLELRTWISGLVFLGLDTFFGGPGEVLAYDWVVPPAPRRAPDLGTWMQSRINFMPLAPPTGMAEIRLPERGPRHPHQGTVTGSTIYQPDFVAPPPGSGYWLIRTRRRLDDDDEEGW